MSGIKNRKEPYIKKNKYIYEPLNLYRDFPLQTDYKMPANFVEYMADFIQQKLQIVKELEKLESDIIEYKKKEFIDLEPSETQNECKSIKLEELYKDNPEELEDSLYTTKSYRDEHGQIKEEKYIDIPVVHKIDEQGNLKLSSIAYYVSNNKLHAVSKSYEITNLKNQLIAQYDIKNSPDIFISTDTFLDDVIINIPAYNFFNPAEEISKPDGEKYEYPIDSADLPENTFKYTCTRRPFDSVFALPICVILHYFQQQDIVPETENELKQNLVTLLGNTVATNNYHLTKEQKDRKEIRHKQICEDIYDQLYSKIISATNATQENYDKAKKLFSKDIRYWETDFKTFMSLYNELHDKFCVETDLCPIPDYPTCKIALQKNWKISQFDNFKELEKYETNKSAKTIRKLELSMGDFVLYLYETYENIIKIYNQIINTKDKNEMFDLLELCTRYSVQLGHYSHNLISKNFTSKGGKTKHKESEQAKNYVLHVMAELLWSYCRSTIQFYNKIKSIEDIIKARVHINTFATIAEYLTNEDNVYQTKYIQYKYAKEDILESLFNDNFETLVSKIKEKASEI